MFDSNVPSRQVMSHIARTQDVRVVNGRERTAGLVNQFQPAFLLASHMHEAANREQISSGNVPYRRAFGEKAAYPVGQHFCSRG